MAVNISEVAEQDMLELIANMRQSDRDEVWASHHLQVEEAVRLSVQLSDISYAVRIDGILVMIYGVCPLPEIDGISPWMLATNDITKHAVKFYRTTKYHIDCMFKAYGYLENYVDARNKRSIRWLKWLGFIIHEPEPFGAEQLLFHRFTMGGD